MASRALHQQVQYFLFAIVMDGISNQKIENNAEKVSAKDKMNEYREREKKTNT